MKFRFARVPKAFAVPSEKEKPDDGKRRIKGKFRLSDIDEFIKVGKVMKSWVSFDEEWEDAYKRVLGVKEYKSLGDGHYDFCDWYETLRPMGFRYFTWFTHRANFRNYSEIILIEPKPYGCAVKDGWREELRITKSHGKCNFANICFERDLHGEDCRDKRINITIHDAEVWLIQQIEKRLRKCIDAELKVTQNSEYSSSKKLWREIYKIAQCNDETVIAKVEYEDYFAETAEGTYCTYFNAIITGFDKAITREIMKRIRYCFSMPFSKKKKCPENRKVIFLKRR